jgi:hypothetical protein
LVSSASASSLLFDFGQTNVASPYLTLDPGHSLATISVSETTWNKIAVSTPNSSLSYGDGSAASGITLTLGQEATVGNGIISYSTAIANLNLAGTGGSVTGQTNFLGVNSIYGNDNASTAVGRDGFFGGGTAAAGAAIGLRIDGIAAGNYLLYVMARNVNSDTTNLPMNVYSAMGASAGTFNFSSLTANTETNRGYSFGTYAGQYTNFVNGENYIGFNLTITNSSDSLFLAVDASGTGSAVETRGFLNMVEIVAVVPEPATTALILLGSVCLIALKRRQSV